MIYKIHHVISPTFFHIKVCFFTLLSALFFGACANKKIEKIADLSCMDTKDAIETYVQKISSTASLTMTALVTEEQMNGLVCDCARPVLTKHLNSYSDTELEMHLTDRSLREKSLKKAIIQNLEALYKCYEKKGTKVLKPIKDFVKNFTNF